MKSKNPSSFFTLVCGIRSVIFYIVLAALCCFFCQLVLLTVALPFSIRMVTARLFCRCVIVAARLICGIRYIVSGQENFIPAPFVLMSNHESAWEIFGLFTLMPPVVFVLKREILWIPVFGWGVALSKPIAIDRSKKQSAIRQVPNQYRW